MRILTAVVFAVVVSTPAYASSHATLEPVVTFRGLHGLTVVREELRVDGIPVHATHVSTLKNARGEAIAQTGRAPILAAEIAEGALRVVGQHAQKYATRTGPGLLQRTLREPVWFVHGTKLKAAYREWRMDVFSAQPRGELVIIDAMTGAELHRAQTIHEHAPQGFRVYAHGDGRPMLSPYGDTWPHPGGSATGWRPTTWAAQSTLRQVDVAAALADPWLDGAATTTSGNNVIVFFNSVVEPDGAVDDMFGPRYGPQFQGADGDFYATTNSGTDFIFAYDPDASATDYFQWPVGAPDMPAGVPGPVDSTDGQLNAKIVQAFYSANWFHDFLYGAGFDEAAGNAQQSNFGRGGIEGDPMIIHSGFLTTFVMVTPDGESPAMALGINDRSASYRDSSLDFGILAHEYGHLVIGRLAGMIGNTTTQARALHEGIGDFFTLLVGMDAGDDFSDAYPVGQYYNLDYVHRAGLPVVGVTPDAMFYGVRRYPFSTDLTLNPLLFSNLNVQPTVPFYDWKGRGPILNGPHTAGEVFSAALFECFAAVVGANDGTPFETLRQRMASYLMGGLALFPEEPTFIEARNAIFDYMRTANAVDYAACRGGFAKRGLGAGAIGPARTSEDLTPVLDGHADAEAQLTLLPGLTGRGSTHAVSVSVRNTGFETIENILLTVVPDLPDAATFPAGETGFVKVLAPGESRTVSIPIRIDVDKLPVVGDTPPNRQFSYSVTATVNGVVEHDYTAQRSELVTRSPSTVQFAAESVRVPDGATSVTLTVERSGEGQEAIEVEYREGGGSAHSGVNYNPVSGTLSWAANDMDPKTITVTGIRSAQSGFEVTLIVSLVNPSTEAEVGDRALTRVVIPGKAGGGGGGGRFGGLLTVALLALCRLRRRDFQTQSDR